MAISTRAHFVLFPTILGMLVVAACGGGDSDGTPSGSSAGSSGSGTAGTNAAGNGASGSNTAGTATAGTAGSGAGSGGAPTAGAGGSGSATVGGGACYQCAVKSCQKDVDACNSQPQCGAYLACIAACPPAAGDPGAPTADCLAKCTPPTDAAAKSAFSAMGKCFDGAGSGACSSACK